MATSSNYRVPANTIAADRETLLALQDMHDYQPVNPNHSVSTLIALEQALRQADAAEVRAQQALASARDIAIAASWAYHNAIIGAKAQVIAQFGNDSLAIQAVGLKKRSDRKRVTRRTPAAPQGEN